MSQAIRPSFYSDFTSRVTETLKDDDKELDEKQQALAYITHYKGWELLKEYKIRLEQHLDTMISESIASGADFKDIGQRTMVAEMAKFVLNSFVKKADEARKIEEK
jgi:hypothetical protein